MKFDIGKVEVIVMVLIGIHEAGLNRETEGITIDRGRQEEKVQITMLDSKEVTTIDKDPHQKVQFQRTIDLGEVIMNIKELVDTIDHDTMRDKEAEVEVTDQDTTKEVKAQNHRRVEGITEGIITQEGTDPHHTQVKVTTGIADIITVEDTKEEVIAEEDHLLTTK
jgi:hypothetical protein